MKRVILFGVLLFLFQPLLLAQIVVLDEGFEDGDFELGTEWTGVNALFTVIDESGNKQLRLDAIDAGTSILTTESSTVYGSWEFFINQDFDPSGSNKSFIFLLSDINDLTGNVNGYAIRTGEGGSDDTFKLYRFTNGTETEILAGQVDLSSGGPFQVKVTRDENGEWELFESAGYGSVPISAGSVIDNTHASSGFFGIQLDYTSSRRQHFYFDDFRIENSVDFSISDVVSYSKQGVEVRFNYKIDESTINTSDFSLSEIGTPTTAEFTGSGFAVRLSFDEEIPNGDYTLIISQIENIYGIEIEPATEIDFSFFMYDEYEEGDIIINEFLKDPPSGAQEYVELKNTSGRFLNLKDWQLGDDGNLTTISSADLPLLPNDFIVISKDTAANSSFFGEAYYHQAALPAFNNGSDQIRLFDGDSVLVDSLSYDSDLGGVKIALERRDASIPAYYQENWGESPAANLGTPGFANQIQPDKNPPEITELIVQDNETLAVVFTERLQATSAQTIANYSLRQNPESGATTPAIPNIQTATLTSPDTLILSLDTQLQEYDGSWMLEAKNLTDIFGNQNDDEMEFNYYIIFTAETGQVVINEFMYDPADQYSEFIELYNVSDSSFDLQNWTLNDNTENLRAITSGSYILPAGKFAVLAPDNTISESFPGIEVLEMGSRFPALNNNTDAIVIRNQNGELIDSLSYFSDWGGSEVSLERKRTDGFSAYRENWADSPSADFGTPGKSNLVKSDNEAPQITDAFSLGSNSIEILFSERIDSAHATNIGNYTITPSISVSDIEYGGDSVTINLLSPMMDGESYLISVLNQQDIFGNILNSTSAEIKYVEFTTAQKSEVIINEFLYRRANAESYEFVEIFNNSSQNFDLSGWSLSDDGNTSTLPTGTVLESGNYLLLTDQEGLAAEFNGVYLSSFPSLNDDEDAIVIKNEEGLLIDSLYYSSTWGNHERGVSLERKDPDAASNDAANWASNITEIGHSINKSSSVFELDETAPEVIFARLQSNNQIFIAFSEFIDADEAEFTIQDKPANIADFDADEANKIILQSSELNAESGIEIHIKGITDIKGNLSGESSIEVAQPISGGAVIINEILFDPLANTDDNLPDQTEYIEFYNTADYAISLEGFYLHDEPDENDEVRSIFPVSSQYKWIPPKSYVLAFADNTASTYKDSQLAKYFENEQQDEHFAIWIDRSSLSLSSSGDAIYLSDSTHSVIDSVFYDESWQNPNLHSTKGISLEKIDPAGPSNDISNWSSSTDISGGTPGYQNSIFQQSAAGPVNSGISFSPNPFSPDDDGFDDNLFINYKLDHSDYLLRVRLFDRYGRLVRQLADGKAAGFEGTLMWDGLTDDRRKNRVGFYIVLFEAYNSAQGKRVTYKETVVLARKF